LRVLLTVPSLAREFGGPVDKARDLAETLRANATEARLVGAGVSDEDGVTALGELGRFHATPIPRRISPLRGLVRGADVVHILGFRDPVGTLAALEARRVRVPYLLEPTGMFRHRLRSFWFKRTFDGSLGRPVLDGAAAVIATSEIEAAELRDAGVPSAQIRVRANGVRFDRFLPLPERGNFRRHRCIPENAPLVLTIARIGAVKGLTTLVGAAAELPGVHVVIAGPDERDGTHDAVRAILDADGLEDRVHILPEGVWGEPKRRALADADVFCLPSDFESFGTAAAEAAGCGLLVVTTSTCGVAPLLDPVCARVVPAGDSRALADAIMDLLRNPPVRDAAARSGAALRERIDWTNLVTEQLKIYRRVIG
jgi:glycosyltransferase involved in cell wall biosynthesis